MCKVLEYEFNWCDFFTPCPHGKDCFVGDYDCTTCPNYDHHVSERETKINNNNLDYKKYFITYKDHIICNK